MDKVSLVVVSHSLTLARGVKELADQMADQQVQIEVAAGILPSARQEPRRGGRDHERAELEALARGR